MLYVRCIAFMSSWVRPRVHAGGDAVIGGDEFIATKSLTPGTNVFNMFQVDKDVVSAEIIFSQWNRLIKFEMPAKSKEPHSLSCRVYSMA